MFWWTIEIEIKIQLVFRTLITLSLQSLGRLYSFIFFWTFLIWNTRKHIVLSRLSKFEFNFFNLLSSSWGLLITSLHKIFISSVRRFTIIFICHHRVNIWHINNKKININLLKEKKENKKIHFLISLFPETVLIYNSLTLIALFKISLTFLSSPQ